ncbi:NAD-dependent epimerase/dehydratase family protein [Thermopirellula anaerolimosa]
MSKVLVTGATGFIGYHLVQTLTERGCDTTCLIRKTSRVDQIRHFGVRFVEGDLSNRESLTKPLHDVQVVYHLAGTTKALRRRDLYRTNETGVVELLEACRRLVNPPVVVLVSSLAAAGPMPAGRPILRTEKDPPRPVSFYGHSKRAGELAAEDRAGDIPITVVRPAIVFGEWDRDCYLMFRPIRRWGIHLVPGYRRKYFSLIHAQDLVPLLLAAAERGERLPGPQDQDAARGTGYYFAAGPDHPTYGQLGKMMGAALGRRVLVLPIAPPVVWLVAAVNTVVGRLTRRPKALSLDKVREALAGSWVCSSEKAERQLGFRVGASLAERLKQTADWYKTQGWL